MSLSVERLFGVADYELGFRVDEPTVIIGPNGAGKTHLLRIVRAVLTADLLELVNIRFDRAVIRFSDGRELVARRYQDEGLQDAVELRACARGRARGEALRANRSTLERLGHDLPPYIEQIGPGRWFDTRSGREFSRTALIRRYGISAEALRPDLSSHPEIKELVGEPWPVLIDTQRLDMAGRESSRSRDARLAGYVENESEAVSRIHEYTRQFRTKVAEARRNSIQATQSADLSFAKRALAAAKMSVKEEYLHQRYDETVDRYNALARNSLAVGEAPLPFPDETTPTIRRILSVFLDDWDKRLEPLMPLNAKISALRAILDDKLAPSGKRTSMSRDGGLEFRASNGKRVLVANLSSGEQHLVALFTLLLFSAERGSVVLIDEPEISFHAAWKHAFIEDVSKVAGLSEIQVVLATHSAAIINGRWDLTEELALVSPDESSSYRLETDALDDGDFIDE